MWKHTGLVALVSLLSAFSAVPSDTGKRSPSMPPQPTKLSHDLEPMELHTALGSRRVHKARLDSLTKSERTPYAHVIFHQIPSRAVYRDIIRIGKIRKVNGHVIRRDGKVYEQWTVNLLGQDINQVRERLAARFPRLFHNLEPYAVDDKLTPKSKGLEPFGPAERDSTTGKMLLWVWFHEDVPAAISEKIMRRNFADKDREYQADKNVVQVNDLSIANKIARIKEVQLVTEYAKGTPVLNHVRSMVRLDRAQILDTTVADPDPGWCNTHCAYSGTFYGRGVQVTAGGSVRKIAVKSRESGKLALTVKGLDVGESCNWRSRGLRVTARPEDVSTEKVCAVLEARFLCPQNNKAPRM